MPGFNKCGMRVAIRRLVILKLKNLEDFDSFFLAALNAECPPRRDRVRSEVSERRRWMTFSSRGTG